MCIDLHTHSCYSDGSHTPTQLVRLALHNRLQALALTDHDTVEGVAELLRCGREAGLTVLSGVEISATWQHHTVHILGYGFDPELPELEHWLRPLQNGRTQRNQAILDKLRALGIAIDRQELEALSGQGQTGRPHIAHLLVRHGVVADFGEAFARYLGRGKAAWAPRFTYTAAEAIAMIHRAGGRAILAHPGMLSADMRVITAVVQELIRSGLDGLEVYYPAHSPALRRELIRLARKHGLLVTGGSDFHGSTRPAHPLVSHAGAFCPPTALLPPLLAAIAARQRPTFQETSPDKGDHAQYSCCR